LIEFIDFINIFNFRLKAGQGAGGTEGDGYVGPFL